MNLTVKAVLARFDGDSVAASEYCHDIMARYPHLRAEYEIISHAIAQKEAARAC